MEKYLIIIKKAGKNWSAYVSDLPGCIATGKTKVIAQKEMQSAIKLHLQGLIEDEIAAPHCLPEL